MNLLYNLRTRGRRGGVECPPQKDFFDFFKKKIYSKGLALSVAVSSYILFQNGRQFSVLLFACKLALVASFKGK